MAELFTVKKVRDDGSEQIERVSAKELESFKKRGFSESGTKRITTETGERTVESEQSRSRDDATGFVSQAQTEQRAREAGTSKRYGSLLERAQTFGESGLSALTFGLADSALEGIAEASGDDASAVATRQRINPGTALAGSVTGTLAGALAGPGSLARFTPAGMAAKAATRAGAKVAAKTGSKLAGFAAEGVVDGALFGAGQAYANATINDEPVNAEKIIAAMGSEALYGGAIGGALGGAIGGLGKLAKRIKADELTPRIASDAVESVITSSKVTPEATEAFTKMQRSVVNIGKTDDAAVILDDVTDFVNKGGEIPKPNPADFDEIAKKHPLVNRPRGDEELEQVLSDTFGDNIGKINESNEFFAKLHASKKAEAVVKKSGGLVNKVKGLAVPAALGVVGGPTGAVLGVMSRGINQGTGKIAEGIQKFASVAGKHRRGTIPAATNILGNITFSTRI